MKTKLLAIVVSATLPFVTWQTHARAGDGGSDSSSEGETGSASEAVGGSSGEASVGESSSGGDGAGGSGASGDGSAGDGGSVGSGDDSGVEGGTCDGPCPTGANSGGGCAIAGFDRETAMSGFALLAGALGLSIVRRRRR